MNHLMVRCRRISSGTISRQLLRKLPSVVVTRRTFTAGSASGERLRVAVVGGGAAGLSSALHMAPLVTAGLINGPIDVYEASQATGRKIGVGIWSTALEPFQFSEQDSHQLLYRDMVQHGTWIRDVGYRSPKGHWLAESSLEDETLPGLLFLREIDMLSSLRKAAHLEEQKGTIQFHAGKSFGVTQIYEESMDPFAAPLVLTGKSADEQAPTTPRDYHLIVAADGMNSVLRKTYGGHLGNRKHLTGTTSLQSPLELPDRKVETDPWDVLGQAEATSTQDRMYTVFRGNSLIKADEIGNVNDNKSFQTWGERNSMRFATVPMRYPDPNDASKESCERHVWFVTTDDKDIIQETDPERRKELLLDLMKDWHYPIHDIIDKTPAEDVLMERAMAHKHSMGPVLNFNKVVKKIRNHPPPSSGHGPTIVFMGDAFMTVDPILAQGFTLGMEGAANLGLSLKDIIQIPPNPRYPKLAFDPIRMRQELQTRHEKRLDRVVCMLRATEIVQALGQPSTGTLSGMISRSILRPIMRFTPGFIKTPFFNAMLKYSLGTHLKNEKDR